jgi:hypothetical protein
MTADRGENALAGAPSLSPAFAGDAAVAVSAPRS